MKSDKLVPEDRGTNFNSTELVNRVELSWGTRDLGYLDDDDMLDITSLAYLFHSVLLLKFPPKSDFFLS